MTERQYVTTAEAAAVAGVAPATIRQWVYRGWLTPTQRDPRGNLYKWEDVLDAERQARERDYSGRTQARIT